MSALTTPTQIGFMLPPSVITKLDVSHLITEVEQVDNELTTAAVRAKAGSQVATHPTISQQLTDFLLLNKIAIDADGRKRTELIKQLRKMKAVVPIIHMTFAVKADPESLQQLAQWLRTSIHPLAVIEVGLQPALVAGVYLRTPNHVHDLSLRALLDGGHDLIVKELESLSGRG